MKLLLEHKIFVGYFFLMAIICSMVAIVLHERSRVLEIEEESSALYQTQRNINTAHHYVTMLATYGESAIAWDEDDCIAYQEHRLRTDSLLLILREQCKDFIHPAQIDTLRTLLESKEEHLFGLMSVFQQQEETDSLLLNYLPIAAQQATQSRTVIRKKKGIAGWFGAKETVQLPPNTTKLNTLNEELLALQTERQEAIDTYTDSLRNHNKELNRKLRILINTMNDQTERAIITKAQHIQNSYDRSVRIITALIISAIFLLVISYLIIQRDIRLKAKNKRRLEEMITQLQYTNRYNEELISSRKKAIRTIVHELRSPLTAISGNAELIERDNKPERLKHLAVIRQSAIRMNTMLSDLLNHFRLDSGKEQVNSRPFRLSHIAETLHTEFAPQTEAKRLVFQVRNCEDEIVVGDKDLILRIGSNLLSNAVKFTDFGKVTLSVNYASGEFTMVVKDTGSGIGQEQQDKIFQPFERLTNAATQDGFGLGLSIVQNLVKLMDGTIELQSETGKGSSFTVRIPIEQATEIIGDSIRPLSSSLPEHLSVLVLDNDEVQLSMTRDMLLRNKSDCDTCRNVHDLLERMRNKNYDLLITDLKMPDMNGYEVLELLRTSAIGNSQHIPVVVATAMDKSAEAELLASGFNACLFKPFSMPELAETVSRCIINSNRWESIDLSPLLVYGDKTEVLERLITETEKEMAQMKEAHEKRDIAGLDSMIHHLRSSWMVIRADLPLQELYDLIHQSRCDEILLDGKVQAVLLVGKEIIRRAKEELCAR